RPASASGSEGPVRTASSSPSAYLPRGRDLGELLAGDRGGPLMTPRELLPGPAALLGPEHPGLQLVEVRQVYMGRRGVAGLPSHGREEPGPGCGAAEEGEGEEDALGGRHRCLLGLCFVKSMTVGSSDAGGSGR